MPASLAETARRFALASCLLCLTTAAAMAADSPGTPEAMTVRVDATNVAQKILQVTEHIPAAPGPLRLRFPRWLPGFHGPYGDVSQIAGLQIRAADQRLAWQRDPGDPFTFVVTVPAGAGAVDLAYQSIAPPASQPYRAPRAQQVIGLQWHAVMLYPEGRPAAEISVLPSVKLPADWQQGSALRATSTQPPSDGWLAFEAVSLETLVDSPLYAGRHYRRVELDPAGTPWPATLHLFADRPDRLQASDAQLDAHRALVRQGTALFGARPWRHYDLLIAIGESLGDTALEHHESSENVYDTDYFKDWPSAARRRDDVAHEFVHAWNGKYRRPADLWAPDFNTPSQDSLLWVYEGMTQYYGLVLAARSGLVSPELVRHHFGREAAFLRDLPGRSWRSLQDTTNDPALGGAGSRPWYDWQRGWDYYDESALMIWLDADTLIREATRGRRSLDDFARSFIGAANGERGPRLYVFDDVVAAMNAVHPHDWKAFFRERLDRTDATAPLDGLTRAGWRLTESDKRSEMDLAALDPEKPTLRLGPSLGLGIAKDGKIRYVSWGGPAFEAGMSEGEQIVAVAMQAYSVERIEAAITANKDGQRPVSLLVKRDDDYRVVTLDVRTGLRYPALARIDGQRDWLAEILAAK